MIPEFTRARLVTEYRSVAEKMAETDDVFRKVYLFSAVNGESQRVLNFEWSDEVALIHIVSLTAYRMLAERIQILAAGPDRTIVVPEGYFDALTEAVAELASVIEANDTQEGLVKVMGTMSKLGYVTSGNGFYLLQKNVLTL